VTTYKIVRFFHDWSVKDVVMATGLTLEEAQEHCNDPESSSSTAKGVLATMDTFEFGPWFDGYTEEI
jgi:hypothetical protein